MEKMAFIDLQMEIVSGMIKTCAIDVRDEWPTNPDSYIKSESISRGAFGIVRMAEINDPAFTLDGMETRSCVIKTLYLRRKFEDLFSRDANDTRKINNTQQFDGKEEKQLAKFLRLQRSIMMELFVLGRCRHANIMHLHAVFMSTDGDLHLVLPRFYVLQYLVSSYKIRKQSQPIPMTIIGKVLRQLCLALDFLQRIGIANRDVHPENIFLTRGGTVKLGHFGQARAVFKEEDENSELWACKTPVGHEEFMAFEKQHNLSLRNTAANNESNWLPYSFSADMWSLGVLVLAMVSYFPDEQGQRLHKNFAFIMHEEQMPFIWLTVDMLQLRSRLVKSGGEDLKLFLSDCLLTVSPERRATAASLPNTPEMKKWCLTSVEEDAAFLRKQFINEVDFANHMKLENDAPNYDTLETKDIPAEFYWDDTWKQLEQLELYLQLRIPSTLGAQSAGFAFKYSDPEPFFRFLYKQATTSPNLELSDLLTLDHEIKQSIFDFFRQNSGPNHHLTFIRRQVQLPPCSSSSKARHLEVEIRSIPEGERRLRLSS